MSVPGGLLSGGEQQMLTLARALARRPRILLADELSLGLAPLIVDRLLQAVRDSARDHGTGVLVVEQHAHKGLRYADRAIVMRRGRVELSLSGEEARSRISEVEQAYLTGAGGSSEPQVTR
jgi:branched-chain amino acid transport system ATP-binding protein